MNRPTSTFQATVRPSFPTHMQTARQAIDNTNHPSSAFQATVRPSFPTHMQTARQAIDNINYPSSFQANVRPYFIYYMRQNSSSSSSSLQAFVRPNVHHNSSSSSSSSSHSQSLQSQPTVHEPVLHQSSSSNSLLNHDQDLVDKYELNLLSEVNIIDGNGNVLKTQKMSIHDLTSQRTQHMPRAGRNVKIVVVRRFNMPQGEAANKLNEVNGIHGLDEQETDYTEDELLEALDLLAPLENFLDHQWQIGKSISHLRKPIAKELVEDERPKKISMEFQSRLIDCFVNSVGTIMCLGILDNSVVHPDYHHFV
ncbi:hypothetical protein Tco_0237539 [Tanacetum coccineum]